MYLAIFIILAIGLGTVFGGNAGDDSMIQTVEQFFDDASLCDGSASVLYPLSEDHIEQSSDRFLVEEAFYTDMEASVGTLRVFGSRKTINTPYVENGRLPEGDNEIFLEKHYADLNGYTCGSSIIAGEKKYTVSGTGCLPDYVYVLKRINDMSSHTASFSTAIVSEDAFSEIKEEFPEKIIANYFFILKNNETSESVKEFFSSAENNICTEFINSDTNPRINTYKEDCYIVKRATFIFAVILMIVISYVMCVFLQNRIERERKYIGTLSALGYRKRELIFHYLGLPLIISEAGGIGSLIAGYFIFSKMLTKDSTDLYSMPDFKVSMPLYIILFAVIVPPLIMFVIGTFMLTRKIASTPNEIIKPKHRAPGTKLKLSGLSYITRYRTRQFFKELTGNAVMIFGVFISTVLLILGYSIYSSIKKYQSDIDGTVKYKYMYYVTGNDQVPEGAEKAEIHNLKYKGSISDLDITLFGISENSRFFTADTAERGADNDVYTVSVSDSFAEKCGIHENDVFTVTDTSGIDEYTLKAGEIVPYSVGLSVFININDAALMINGERDHYNTLLTENEIDKDSVNILAAYTSEEYTEAADSMLESLMLIIIALLGSAAIIFVTVLFLMLKFMTDKAKNNISLLKILGYHSNEVNKIYLGGETYIIIIAILLSLPLGTLVIKALFPYLTAGYSVRLDPGITLSGYAILAVFMFAAYAVLYIYLRFRLAGISFTEILKERE